MNNGVQLELNGTVGTISWSIQTNLTMPTNLHVFYGHLYQAENKFYNMRTE